MTTTKAPPRTGDAADAAPPVRAKAPLSYRLRPVLSYALLIAVAIFFLIPFYLIVRNALLSDEEITATTWKWIPTSPDWGNFVELFSNPGAPMLTGLKNSAIIAAVTLVFSMLFSSMAGYALARIPFRWSTSVFWFILATLMIPSAVTFVPTFVVVGSLGGVNTLWGIIAPGLFTGLATFLFRQFYLRFPKDLEDAGRIDGLGWFGIYWRLLLPNSKGIMMALGVVAFINSWNAFLWPLVIGQDPSTWTIQIVLSTYLTSQAIDLSQLFAAAAVAIAPLVVVFFFMQRHIIEGVTLSGTKE